MLTVSSLKKFYFLPDMHDMRFKADTLMVFIKAKLGRNPYSGDVYLFMSKDRHQVRLVHYENNAFHTQTKTFKKGYKFMKIARDENGRKVYEMSWKDIVALLECPVIEVLKLGEGLADNAG